MKLLYLVRLDSAQRKDGLTAVLNYLCREGFTNEITVWEVDAQPYPGFVQWCVGEKHISYEFHVDNDPAFHRTLWSNKMVMACRDAVAAICHADVLVPYQQILQADELVRNGAKYVAAFGDETDEYGLMRGNEKYLTHMLAGGNPDEILHDDTMLDYPFKRRLGSYSGMVFLNRAAYLAAGMDDERIVGWGPEEVERHVRLTRLGSGYKRVLGWAVHMPHPGAYSQAEQRARNEREFQRMYSMTPEMIKAEVALWKRNRGY